MLVVEIVGRCAVKWTGGEQKIEKNNARIEHIYCLAFVTSWYGGLVKVLLDFWGQDTWRSSQRTQPSRLLTLSVGNVVSLIGTGAAIERSCQTQVRDLELSVLANKKVGDLNISVNKATLMDGLDSFQKRKEDLKSVKLFETLGEL